MGGGVGHARRVVEHGEQLEVAGGQARPPRPARGGPSSSGGSPSTSRMPAGISMSSASRAGRYWRTSTTDGVALGVEQDGHDADRAGRAHDVALERRAVGRLERGRPRPARCGPDGPRARRRAGSRRPRPVTPPARWPAPRRSLGGRPLEGDVRVAALGPRQRRRDQLAEQRVGPVGPALELGVGLGADVERMVGQLHELDQAAVGRQAGQQEAGRPRTGCGRRC